MKNCLEFAITELRTFIVTFGVFAVIDVLTKFDIMTNVITLNKHYLRTEDVEQMMFGATQSELGYNLKAYSYLIDHLIKIICNPSSPEESLRINTALKTLCMKVGDNAGRFYHLLSEGLHRRMIFNKLSQIYGSLAEEIKVNKELLIMLINNKFIDMNHMNELSFGVDGNEQAVRIAHYLIHNVNNYCRVKNFLYIIQGWTRDNNLIEDLEEIVYDIEMYQYLKIKEKIQGDMQKKFASFIKLL